MLWDYGTWQPEVQDIDAALDTGDLEFTLDGYKLKGSWVLVRTRDRPGTAASQKGRSWLLIKHRDHWSGPLDITTFAPLSVKSEADFDDILAAELLDTWVTGRPGTGGVPNKKLRDVVAKAAAKIADRENASESLAPRAARAKKRKSIRG